jgi:hypothetical protein
MWRVLFRDLQNDVWKLVPRHEQKRARCYSQHQRAEVVIIWLTAQQSAFLTEPRLPQAPGRFVSGPKEQPG